jgi:4-amino-4-deoxy-L-arabinose transferase-like glycosyltransferase
MYKLAFIHGQANNISGETWATVLTSNSLRLIISWRKKLEQTKYFVFVIVAIGVLIRLISIPLFASVPYTPVDVYYVDNQAAKIILDFQNPYSQNLVAHGYALNMFAYLPMVPIYYAPFYLLGDIRLGSIFADILIMFSLYFIAKSINRGAAAFFAPLAYAILPFSIWLTSVASTNIMIGTAFLAISTAALLKRKHLVAAIFLGLALATNQLVFLSLPLFIFYFWRERKISYFLGSLLVTAGIILPFFLQDTFSFIYDVILYQFQRPLQSNGIFSLYSLINTTTGLSLTSWIRVTLFLMAMFIAVILLRRKTVFLVPLVGTLLFLGAFILPVNGFWNYFLPGAAFLIACIPYVIDEMTTRLEKSTST